MVIRPSGHDAALIERLLAPVTGRPVASLTIRPRLVLAATLADHQPAFAATARRAGVPVLVDPQTPYLQDYQHRDDPWAALPFGDRCALTPADLSASRQHHLTGAALAHQIRAGATRLITPYLHITRADDGWTERQIGIYRATRATLDATGVRLPLTAVIDLGWRLLDRTTWPDVLTPLLTAAAAAGADEIALAGSGVDAGIHPDQRLFALIASVRHCARTAPVIAWNQGRLGEVCVAAGAAGYESGIGWRERCDANEWSRAHRPAPPGKDSGRTARPVYIDKLRRSIPKSTVEHLVGQRGIAPDLPCADTRGCCRNGVTGLLGDSRWHTIHSRVRTLRDLHDIDAAFRWVHLATVAATGLDLAKRINAIAAREGFFKVDAAHLSATGVCARALHAGRRRRAA
jgi:hypothetical protein